MAKIKLPDQQELELPDEIASKDSDLKDALAPYFPDLANATFSRKTKDGMLTVEVVKRAGTKGSAARKTEG